MCRRSGGRDHIGGGGEHRTKPLVIGAMHERRHARLTVSFARYAPSCGRPSVASISSAVEISSRVRRIESLSTARRKSRYGTPRSVAVMRSTSE